MRTGRSLVFITQPPPPRGDVLPNGTLHFKSIVCPRLCAKHLANMISLMLVTSRKVDVSGASDSRRRDRGSERIQLVWCGGFLLGLWGQLPALPLAACVNTTLRKLPAINYKG